MCPSYMVTREEKHSTRGRAHLLFEMLNGDALDRRLAERGGEGGARPVPACKGCKGDCPVNVDMATYKAEFLSHYYEGRLRPRHAYAFGLIDRWARLASLRAGLANFVTQTPGLAPLAKCAGGRRAAARRCRAFAPHDVPRVVRARGRAQRRRPRGGPLARHVQQPLPPGLGVAAVEVLEAAGFR